MTRLGTLGVDTTKDILDCAIFTAGVHGLQYNQQTALVFGIQAFLELLKALALILKFFLNVFLFLIMFGGVWIDIS
jgi:hypothetical protein